MNKYSIVILLAILSNAIGCKVDNSSADEAIRNEGYAKLAQQKKENKLKKYDEGEKKVKRKRLVESKISTSNTPKEVNFEWKAISDLKRSNLSKKNLIYIYVDDCTECRKMEDQVFSSKRVQDQLSGNFNVVRFNGEEKSVVNFNKKTYKFVKSGPRGSNLLALLLMNGKAEYPSVVVLDRQLEKVKVLKGFLSAEQLLKEVEGM